MLGFFKNKKAKELLGRKERWAKIEELWYEDKIPSPYDALMFYAADIRNSGHSMFFSRIQEHDLTGHTMDELIPLLPAKFEENVLEAYRVYIRLKEEGKDEETIYDELVKYNRFFVEHDEEILEILELSCKISL